MLSDKFDIILSADEYCFEDKINNVELWEICFCFNFNETEIDVTFRWHVEDDEDVFYFHPKILEHPDKFIDEVRNSYEYVNVISRLGPEDITYDISVKEKDGEENFTLRIEYEFLHCTIKISTEELHYFLTILNQTLKICLTWTDK